jgi:hypothetical protein
MESDGTAFRFPVCRALWIAQFVGSIGTCARPSGQSGSWAISLAPRRGCGRADAATLLLCSRSHAQVVRCVYLREHTPRLSSLSSDSARGHGEKSWSRSRLPDVSSSPRGAAEWRNRPCARISSALTMFRTPGQGRPRRRAKVLEEKGSRVDESPPTEALDHKRPSAAGVAQAEPMAHTPAGRRAPLLRPVPDAV